MSENFAILISWLGFKKNLLLYYCLFLLSTTALSQSDIYSGTWSMNFHPKKDKPLIHVEILIGLAEKNVLYPALLKISCDSFFASYEFLLVKKNSRELAISKNKYAIIEKPYSLGKATYFLNGIFDYGRDLKGQPLLTINRIQPKKNKTNLPDTLQIEKANRFNAMYISSFLNDAEIVLNKINSSPWKDENNGRILSPSLSPEYFGLKDTVFLPTQDGVLYLTGNKKEDMVSVALNGRTLLDQHVTAKKPYTEEILLDTGLNLVALFADNFGNELPNKSKLALEFAKKRINLDFTTRSDSASSVIVAMLYCGYDKEKDIYFEEYVSGGQKEGQLDKNEKLLANIQSTSAQLTLAVWDDAVDDGDSISIKINGSWIAKGMPVRKKPQFIKVNLKPGPNSITFIADNLGTIPPNTSVLEIIDGKKRKAFMLESIPGENKLLNIFYELKGN